MTPQQTIGPYRITAKLGEGGMGEVWRATDTRLNREVAIKVLPAALANDAQYMARFEREAQTLAALNHPNIAAIYGIEQSAIVMELVEGETLPCPVPLATALDYARQIAEGLEAAHEKGIVHRDLKPANIRVTPDGRLKILDFGLAKSAAESAAATSAGPTISPTLSLAMTQAGMILGTAGYMAPEQAAGKTVDRRADIWSFGVVLYELLTSKPLFTGETISHTLASVLKDEIVLDIPQAPPPIRRLLARCLNRDPRERLRDIGEARIAIRDYLANPAADSDLERARAPHSNSSRPGRLGHWFPRVLFAGLFLSLASSLAWIFKPAPPLAVARFPLPLAEGQIFTNPGRLSLAISPDGNEIVYVANRQLYLRSLAGFSTRPIAGSEVSGGTVTTPVFSPDGKWIAFFDGVSRTIKRIAVSGGVPVTVCEAGGLIGMEWNDDGVLFASSDKGIQRVSPNGGQPEVLVPPKGDETLANPQMLPGGRAVLFSRGELDSTGFPRANTWHVAVQELKSGARKVVVQAGINARYLPTGHLVYFSNGVLFAVPFHLRRLDPIGGAVGVVEGVARVGSTAQFAISSAGSLIYVPGPVTTGGVAQDVLAIIDGQGKIEAVQMPQGAYGYPRASRDGQNVAYQRVDGKESSIWICNIAGRAAPRRLTLPDTGANRYPIWSPDDQRVAFQSDREGDVAIWWQRADGSGVAERLSRADKRVAHVPDSWSPDGQTISFTLEKENASEVWTYSLRERKPALLAAAPGAVLGKSAFSPDGRWVAYQLRAGPGTSRIYVRPFPPTGTAYVAPEDQDSHHPVWSPDGKKLFYVPGPGQFGSMNVNTRPSLSFGSPVRAPQSGFATQSSASVRTFDVLPDGKRFIGVVTPGQLQLGTSGGSQIHVVLNWFEDVKQRARAD
jgi:serine/threonine protein kinase/Tol biopolymer transport system component